jgi:hypothetical protein
MECLWHTAPALPQRHHRREEETAFISTQTTTILARFLPDATLLRLEACALDDATSQITLAVRSTQASAPCPVCTTPAYRIHSHCERTLADLPWAHYRVRLQLRVRKWFCRNRHCHRRIFTERLPTVAVPWARRTLRLAPAPGRARRGAGRDSGGTPRPRVGPAGQPEPAAAPAAGAGLSHAPRLGRR